MCSGWSPMTPTAWRRAPAASRSWRLAPTEKRRSKMAIVSVNPATEEELTRFEEHTWDQVDGALQRAYDARYAWRDAGFDARAARLTDLAAYLRAEKQRLAGLLTAEMGKPIVEAEAEVEKCAWTADWFAEN